MFLACSLLIPCLFLGSEWRLCKKLRKEGTTYFYNFCNFLIITSLMVCIQKHSVKVASAGKGLSRLVLDYTQKHTYSLIYYLLIYYFLGICPASRSVNDLVLRSNNDLNLKLEGYSLDIKRTHHRLAWLVCLVLPQTEQFHGHCQT